MQKEWRLRKKLQWYSANIEAWSHSWHISIKEAVARFKVTFWCWCCLACDCHWLRLRPADLVSAESKHSRPVSSERQNSTLLQWHDHWSLIRSWAGHWTPGELMYWQLLARAGIKESTVYDTSVITISLTPLLFSLSPRWGCGQGGQAGHIDRVTGPRAEPRGLTPGLQGVRARVPGRGGHQSHT